MISDLSFKNILLKIQDFINFFFTTSAYQITGAVVILILLYLLIKRIKPKKAESKVKFIDGRKLEKSGNLREAAEAYMAEKKYSKAAEIFMKTGMLARAAECYEYLGQKQTAASLYERNGNIREAVEIYISLGMMNEALDLLERNKKYYEAAELAEKMKNYEVAGYMYQKAGIEDRAGMNYFYARKFDKALPLLKKTLSEYKKMRNEIPEEPATMLAKCYESLKEYLEAGKVYYLIGKKEEAAESFEKAGEFEFALKLFKELGNEERAKQLEDVVGHSVSENLSAEQIESSNYSEPVKKEKLEESANPEEMIKQLISQKKYKRAGQLLLKMGKLRESAEVFSKGKEYLLAAQVYQRIGDPVMQSEMLFRSGKYFEAVLNLYETGNLREAEDMIKGVPKETIDYKRVHKILGDILIQRGEMKEAARAYGVSISGEKIRPWNIMAFYHLGNIAEEVKNYDAALTLYSAIYKYDRKFMDVSERIEGIRDKLKKEKSTKDETVPRYIVKEVGKQKTLEKKEHRYSILEEIGRGGMGVVYKAKDNLLERFVAYKVLPSYMKKEKGAVENFIKEAKATASLTHPNIVTVYDAGEEDDNYYIAMELVEGETLKEMIKKYGKINLKAFFVMASQICKAISYAHSRSIIHRDIKPSNIMWTREKLVKVMDLGLAKVIQDAANFHTVVGGTPHYMSPEQILGGEITFATDIYSLGVTFYEMVTGRVPFPKGNVGYHHVHTPPTPLREIDPSIPEEVEKIILKCLEKKPENRYKSVNELYNDLKKAVENFHNGQDKSSR